MILLQFTKKAAARHKLNQRKAASSEGKPIDVTLAYITLDEATVTATRKPRMVREGNKVPTDHPDASPNKARTNRCSS